MSSDSPLLLLTLAALAIGLAGAVYLILSPYISAGSRTARRIQVVSESKGKRVALKVQTETTNNRRKSVAETLKELEDRQKPKQKMTLRAKLQQAGLDIPNQSFYVISASCGLLIAMLLFLTTSSPLVPLLGGFVGGFGLPQWILGKLIKRRQNKFLDEFANAIDVIVRGVKSGLPLTECLAIIGRESAEPVAAEFRELVEQQRVGVTLPEAFERMMQRMPLQEVRFFGIVVGIAQQSGGNLSEALGNLSGVLRERKKLQGKVASMSAEAKASAAVLGSLPFAVMILVYITTPSYISILWTTSFGQFALACAGAWMTCGLLVMRKMINFKY